METVQQREAVTNEIRTAARHSAVYGLGAVAVKAVGFLMLPVYTHYLTPADYGIHRRFLTSACLFWVWFSTWG